jgi:tRNA/rRNA methyltransferase
MTAGCGFSPAASRNRCRLRYNGRNRVTAPRKSMPGSGTDSTKSWTAVDGPVVILIEPQLGENIGTAARAMANFGLTRLRLVRPRDGWPNINAERAASGADEVLRQVEIFDTLTAAIADCHFVLATTARAHDQAKPVLGPREAAPAIAERIASGETAAVLFGRERWGLTNEEVGLADRIVTFPVNPAFASLNLAQSVLLVAYEYFRVAHGDALPFAMPNKSPPASKQQLLAFFTAIEQELEKIEYFRPLDKRDTMQINMRNIFTRMQPTQQDIRTLHGIITSIAEGRKGPARGGVLDGAQAEVLRTLIAEHGHGRVAGERGPVRGLARLLRRNPTEAERALWEALSRDRRFANLGFKRQVPVGPHITDIVSFPLRVVIDVEPDHEGEAAAIERSARRAWLEERGYRVLAVRGGAIEQDCQAVIEDLLARLGRP